MICASRTAVAARHAVEAANSIGVGSRSKSAAVAIDGSGGYDVSTTVPVSGLGHRYQVKASEGLTDPDWQPASGVMPGDGGELIIEVPVGAETNRFYKLDTWRQ